MNYWPQQQQQPAQAVQAHPVAHAHMSSYPPASVPSDPYMAHYPPHMLQQTGFTGQQPTGFYQPQPHAPAAAQAYQQALPAVRPDVPGHAAQPAMSSLSAPSSSPSTAATDDPAVRHTPPHHGYAVLISDQFTHILRSKSLSLGRHMQGSEQPPGTLGVSTAKNISRNHATLQFDPEYVPPGAPASYPGAWVITCHGKNGIQVNGVLKGAQTHFPVKHKDRMQIGDTVFYFIEPAPMR